MDPGSSAETTRTVVLPDEGVEALFGPYDENLRLIESLAGVRLSTQGHALRVTGEAENVARVEHLLGRLLALQKDGYRLTNGDVKTAADLLMQDPTADLRDYFLKSALPPGGGRRAVSARSLNQRRYVEAIDRADIVFGIGPAGTGKTYLAVAAGGAFLLTKRVNRIILARPAVEAGEKLGFLPGDLQEKVNPYLRPLYDALYDMMDAERAERLDGPRHDRDRAAGVHARPHAERRLRHPGRGAEHQHRADEDVPDAARVRLEGRRHRGHHADRPAGREDLGADRGDQGRRGRRGRGVRVLRRAGRGPAQARAADRPGLRGVQQRRSQGSSPGGLAVTARSRRGGPSGLRVAVTSHVARPVRSTGLGPWLASVAPPRARGEVSVALVGDGRMRALNRCHRGKDTPTDVLSFPSGEREFLGDIVIAAGVARRQARAAGHSFGVETRVLALHGLLHLLGYDHETDDGGMHRLEARLRRRGGLREGLIERRKEGPR